MRIHGTLFVSSIAITACSASPSNAAEGQPDVASRVASSEVVIAEDAVVDLSIFSDYRRMMEETERVAARVAAGSVTGCSRLVTFDGLGGWRCVDGLRGVPQQVADLDGQRVAMVGYLLPIDVDDYILVESPAQLDVGAPPLNRIVHVCEPMLEDPYQVLGVPVMLVGILSVREVRHYGTCVFIYELDAQQVELLGKPEPVRRVQH